MGIAAFATPQADGQVLFARFSPLMPKATQDLHTHKTLPIFLMRPTPNRH